MIRPTAIVDLRVPSGLPAHTVAANQLTNIGPGETYELIIDIEPAGLMRACQEQLKETFRWEVVTDGPPVWRLRVRREREVIAADLAELLERDHERLDVLLRDALEHMDAERPEAATSVLRQFTAGMRRHIKAENDVLGRFMLEHTDSNRTSEVVQNMLGEHETLLRELAIIDAALRRGERDAPARLKQFRTVLGVHEREERHRLNPAWARLVARLTGEDTQLQLYSQVAAILDERGGAPPDAQHTQ